MTQKSHLDLQAFLRETAEELNDLASMDTMEMYRHLTTLGQGLARWGEPAKVPENFVHGCTSNVYIAASLTDGRVQFAGSSEALVVRGYVAILVEGLSGLTVADLLAHSEGPIEEFAAVTNIRAALTPSRANAFGNIYRLMMDKVQAFSRQGEA